MAKKIYQSPYTYKIERPKECPFRLETLDANGRPMPCCLNGAESMCPSEIEFANDCPLEDDNLE